MFKIDKALQDKINLFTLNANNELEFVYKDDILNEVTTLAKSIFGDNVNTDPSTALGQILTYFTQSTLTEIAYLEQLGNAFFLGGQGEFLDNWAWNVFRVKRKQQIKSSVLIKIIGTPNTQIPAGFTITDGTRNYIIQAPTQIEFNSEVTALFVAEEFSNYIAPPNTINKMVTIVQGVERVNNENQATEPINRESDSDLFNRCLVFGSTAKNATFRSILSNVAQAQGVTKIAGAENFTNEIIEVKGVKISPHSVAIVVLGGKNEDIANAIFESRATGCGLDGNTEVKIILNNLEYIYKFYRPIEVPLKVEVKVGAENVLIPSNFENQAKTALIEYIQNRDIAEIITQPKLSQELIKNINGINVLDLKFGLKSGVLAYEPVTLKLTELATLSADDIVVTEIK